MPPPLNFAEKMRRHDRERERVFRQRLRYGAYIVLGLAGLVLVTARISLELVRYL